ncbi:branched-chain amino acid ABC transporter permease [Cloacibacillus porcorum]|jgi:branched-chain amino acid transport system permease protein|uniref:branched-chain amino acid ABC transporter permease n=1 Tax=Cloacibacillus porcorum TaxID=1197717 RepID=UPI0009FBCB09|nr:branched-chain amino acid ABC transporter permease [Cloacibacillus porcorum]MCI5865005.1 branched-chain amino acid ABC transporter permease [Cloacibacillus porcorum]MDD7648906.1 branched-chain amino acid ABC transporter permease [Cloacibacillus porcorum]MDY4094917.1 branched-chain amino acid ABC transporter permease [Cloacibacillus porcorum]
MELFIEQFLNGLGAGAMYALITLGLALIYGVMKILHVAHASVYTAGAYMGLYIFLSTGSVLIAVIVSMAFCSVLGVLIERYIYYPLLKYPPYVPLISSIALLIAIEEFCRLVAGPEVRTFPAALPFPSAVVCGVTISSTLMAVYCLTVIILIALWLLMTKTELGLAMRAVAQDMETAASLGVNTQRTVALTFVIGSAIAAIAGILMGIYYNQVYPMMGEVPAYKTLALIVVGGMGSVPGAVLASLLLGLGETFLIGYANIPLPRDALAFIAMIVILMWKPTGLLGKR